MTTPDNIDPAADFKGYQNALFKSLVSATAAINSIPVDEIGFYRSLDRQFAKVLDQTASICLSTANNLLHRCADDVGIEHKQFDDVDDVTQRYKSVTEVCDGLVDKADIFMEQMRDTGKTEDKKEIAPEMIEVATKEKLNYKFLHANNVIRPQVKFKDPVDNSNSTPFERKIKYKPHAKVPLDFTQPEPVDDIPQSLPHPYQYEIEHLDYPSHMFEVKEPISYTPFDTTSYTWVDTEEALMKMMKSFDGVKELAVDLEHHNYRSYQGFTCLMQISTREEDFIIDTLELRDKLWMLNEYFADPDIVKVLHGADSDIIWLQRDFGLYIVNLFDTYFPTKVMDFPRHGLSYLLKKYCNYDTDKRYQLADWRIRPIPEEMLTYARSDTHFLLYIYDHLRNELLSLPSQSVSPMKICLDKSSSVSLKKYDKEVYDSVNGLGSEGWSRMKEKWKYPMTNQQLQIFKDLHSWRDQLAREEDESLRYVLPNHMLFSLVERMPTDASGVIGCCNPCPTLVRMNAQAICLVIHKAKMMAVNTDTPEKVEETTSKVDVDVKSAKPTVVVTTMKMKPLKRKANETEGLFDLDEIKKRRSENVSQLEKKTSALFASYF
ncbi:ribonuclease H-like domain-containing protein [Pilobolus umbonatus]|nr:ribonuclease H-like domain-containing protein [Pilobolus umbonatus]